MTLNKYQKANELIHLKEGQKDAMIERIMAMDTEPVRRPFPWKYWLAGFAAIVLVFVSAGPYRRTSETAGATATMREESSADQVMAAGTETFEAAADAAPASIADSERMKESAEEAAVNSFIAASPQDSALKEDGTVSYRVINDPKETEASLSSWGEKHTVMIEATEVTVYGNQAAEFTVQGTVIQVIFDQPVTEEELKQSVGEVIRG